MLTVTSRALQQLAALLLERAGLKITPDGYHSLRLALCTRMPVVGLSDSEEYVRRLRAPDAEDELRKLLPLVTVGHTEFFRDPKQFRALETRILPDALWRARRENRRVSIWSAGCATGEEPYSLAMVLAEQGALPIEVDLWATDLNLAVSVFEKVKPESLDLILCRNVIIYFDLPTIRALMDRFLTALRPGALLLLGYSESLFKVYDRFEMVEVDGAFVYRRPEKPLPPRAPTSSPKSMTLAALPPARPSATSTLARPRETTNAVVPAPVSNPAVVPVTRVLKQTLEVSPETPGTNTQRKRKS
ncbi:MAG TPA: CheR family methyltransferase, partial [Myxococcaceae bacterium]|nr:CheR family methyltransferase [Myxococcaceae bacterium]